MSRLKNRLIARVLGAFPALEKVFTGAYTPLESGHVPWTPVKKALRLCKVAVVTTAGVHHRDQPPFDMEDQNGDPTFRLLDASRPVSDLMITHDYYDHADADKDINIVFPVERLREFEEEGVVGELAGENYGFMGHIVGPHIGNLLDEYAPEVARRLKRGRIDAVLLTPG